MKQPAITFALALLAGAACNPKHDTEKPDGGGKGACTEEAKVCPDGSSVARSGPDCEFAACPGEGEPKPEPEGDTAAPEGEGGGEPEPATDAE